MSGGMVAVTSGAEAIKKREDGQKRIAKIAVPVFGVLMLAAGIAGTAFLQPSGARLLLMSASALFYVLSYSTLLCGQWTIGMIPQAGIGAYFFTLAALAPAVMSIDVPWLKTAVWIIFALFGIPVLFFLVSIAVMAVGARSPRDRGEYTLMVLGCKLKEGRPGRMLRRRLNKAAEELERDNTLMCVVSGGRAPDQTLAEAEAMAEYLRERGIAPERIIVEKMSSTTYENFLFSKNLLEQYDLPRRVGVVTDRFHQFRSGRIARTAGIESFPVGCRTAWYLAVQFWMRDVLCIIERMIRGHW